VLLLALKGGTLDFTVADMDFVLFNYGSVVVLKPLTDAAKVWSKRYIQKRVDYQPLASLGSVVVMPQALPKILADIHSTGLRSERGEVSGA